MACIKWRSVRLCSQLKITGNRLLCFRIVLSRRMSSQSDVVGEERKLTTRISSNRYVKVIGTGASETPPSLYLFTDSARYMFNCGTSTERFCLEHRMRVSKLENVFITRPSWDCWGGLLGLAMGMRNFDASMESKLELNLYGPEGIREFEKAIGHVVHGERIGFNPCVLEKDCAILYKDDEIIVTGVKLQAAEEQRISNVPSEEKLDCDEPHLKQRKTERVHTSIVYVCKMTDIPGKFDNAKAKALGLKPGPLYAKLVRGEPVSGPDGSVIHPSDVIGPPYLGPVFVVIDCPNEQILSQLLSSKSIFETASMPNRSLLIAHITPRDILQSKEYMEWAEKFGESARHVFLHSTVCDQEYVFRRNLKIQAPLNAISSGVFLIPEKEILQPQLCLSPSLQSVSRRGRIMLMHHFYPSKKEGWDESNCLLPVPDVADAYLKETKHSLEINQKSALLEPTKDIYGKDKRDVRITFLGTGSAIPSKYRNVTSILLELPTGYYILLDCGEGTLNQLYRCYGSRTNDILRKLSCVFVSHMHGDHNLDLIHIIRRHQKVCSSSTAEDKKLLVMGPRKLNDMLISYSENCEELKYLFALNYHHRHNSLKSPSSIVQSALTELGLQSIHTVLVDHCYDAYGVVLNAGDAKGRIVFSGDTRPCQDLIEVGKGAKLLIHEATFEDELKKEALERKHCIMSEAFKVSEDMQAQHTILTHFSQRSYCPKVPSKVFETSSSTLLAFDCMRVGLSQMDRLYEVQVTVSDVLNQIIDNEPES